MYDIAIISGDGIGLEVMDACEFLLDKLDLEFSFKYGEAGFDCFNKNGTTLPQETIDMANKSDAVLFGASTSTPGQPSPIINLRKALNVLLAIAVFVCGEQLWLCTLFERNNEVSVIVLLAFFHVCIADVCVQIAL